MLYMVKAQTKFLSAKLASGRQNITKCVQGNKFKFTHKPIVKTYYSYWLFGLMRV